MVIRPLEPEDKSEWLRMRIALWPDVSLQSQLSEIEEFATDLTDLAAFVMVRSAGGLGGFLEASLRPYAEGCETRPVGYIEGWYVDADLRRQGIGGELVRTAEAWALARGCQEMASDCVLENLVSFQAHLALGYVETNRLICFKKQLDTASPAAVAPFTSGASGSDRSHASRPTRTVVVRQIEESDAARFLELAKALDAETVYRPFDPGERRTTVEEQREIIRRMRAAGNQTVLLAEVEGQLVGCLEALGGGYRKTRHTVHVVVAILLRFTGQGIGTRLFEELERWASERGLHRLQLSVMLDSHRALRLYQRLGFQIEGVKRHSLRINGLYVDEYYMSKLLG